MSAAPESSETPDHDQLNDDLNEIYGNDPCAVCGRVLKKHFDMKGVEGKGAWCSPPPYDARHFIPEAFHAR